MCFSTVKGKINQVEQLLVIDQQNAARNTRYNALDRWTEQLVPLYQAITSRLL